MDICYSDYTQFKLLYLEYDSYYLLGLGMQWTPPNPSQIGVVVRFEFVGVVMEIDRSRKY
jgi:hypothetical protein